MGKGVLLVLDQALLHVDLPMPSELYVKVWCIACTNVNIN